MESLQIQQATIDSREVAEMVDIRHSDLLEKIGGSKKVVGYIEVLTNGKFRSLDFFIESTYKDSKGEIRKCYLLTKKGCDMVANKLTGEKGVLFTARYITRFEEMEKQLTTPRLPQTYREALQHLITQVEENEKLQTSNLLLNQQVNELQPKATYYDLVLQNKTLLSITTIAKDYGMGAVTMNKLLNQLGIQYKQGGIWLLYSKYQDKGYTQTSTHVIDSERSAVTTKWTQKGRLFLYELLKKNNYLPLIEKGEDVG